MLLVAARYGAFQRTFRIPTIVDQAQVQTTSHNGVFALRLSKHAASIPKGIALAG